MSLLKSTPTYEYTHTPLRGEFAKSGCSSGEIENYMKNEIVWLKSNAEGDQHMEIDVTTKPWSDDAKSFITELEKKAKELNATHLTIANVGEGGGFAKKFPAEGLIKAFNEAANRNGLKKVNNKVWRWKTKKLDDNYNNIIFHFCYIQFVWPSDEEDPVAKADKILEQMKNDGTL